MCDGCKTIFYCSADCQEQDASLHKTLCYTWSDFQSRPSDLYRRAILFPENEQQGSIRFVWLIFHQNIDDEGDLYDKPNLKEFFAAKGGKVERCLIENKILSRPLDHTINIVSYGEGFKHAGENRTILNFRDSKHAHPFKGPVLAYATELGSGTLPKSSDLVLQDLRHVVDYLTSHQGTAVLGDFTRYFGQTVRGVRVNCDGDIKVEPSMRPVFEPVKVPLTHKIFSGSAFLPIAEKLDLHILFAKYPRTQEYEANIVDYEGRAALLRHNEMDWNAIARDLTQSWLLEDEEKRARKTGHPLDFECSKCFFQGSLILARQDKKPLYPHHVEMLWLYNKRWLELLMTCVANIHLDPDEKKSFEQKLAEQTTREAFELYHEHLQTKGTADERKLPSPYEVKKKRGSVKRKLEEMGFLSKWSKRGKWIYSSDGDDE